MAADESIKVTINRIVKKHGKLSLILLHLILKDFSLKIIVNGLHKHFRDKFQRGLQRLTILDL